MTPALQLDDCCMFKSGIWQDERDKLTVCAGVFISPKYQLLKDVFPFVILSRIRLHILKIYLR